MIWDTTYLIRFDDICPTMNWHVWDAVERVLCDLCISPILAVVPDNRDPLLMHSPENAAFWERARSWQDRGWPIALHGYRHVYDSADSGIMGINPFSEFAGHSVEEQRERISSGMRVLRQEGIAPRLWVAPAHSFDHATLTVLRDEGVTIVSDGFWPLPHKDEDGLLWIPQQFATFQRLPFTLQTVCMHINSWKEIDIRRFDRSVRRHRDRIVELDWVVAHFADKRLSAGNVLGQRVLRAVLTLKRKVRNRAHAHQLAQR